MKMIKTASLAAAALMTLSSSSFALGKKEKSILKSLLLPPLILPTPSGKILTIKPGDSKIKVTKIPTPPIIVPTPRVMHVPTPIVMPTPRVFVPKVKVIKVPTPPIVVPTPIVVVPVRHSYVHADVDTRRDEPCVKTVVIADSTDEDCDVVTTPPPRPLNERVCRCPSRSYVWVSGYWTLRHNRWEWVHGTWVEPPQPRVRWVPGRWERVRGGWSWSEGYWYGRNYDSRNYRRHHRNEKTYRRDDDNRRRDADKRDDDSRKRHECHGH